MVDGNQDQIIFGNPMPDIHQVGAEIKDVGKVRLFYSESNQGVTEQAAGIAISSQKTFYDILKVQGGIRRSTAQRDLLFSTLYQNNLYLSFIPSLELKRSFGGTRVELEAGIASRASIGCNNLERGDCAGNSQSSLNGFANARVTQDLLGIGKPLFTQAQLSTILP